MSRGSTRRTGSMRACLVLDLVIIHFFLFELNDT